MPSVINTANNLTDTIHADSENIADISVNDDANQTQLDVELDDPQPDYPVEEGIFDSVQ
jgi:hypothetical protein